MTRPTRRHRLRGRARAKEGGNGKWAGQAGRSGAGSEGNRGGGTFTLDYKKVGNKNWQTLDITLKPTGYSAWYNRARRWLANGCEEVGDLLGLVKRETQELTSEKERRLWQRARVPYPLEEVNAAVADGIVYTGTDDVATRSTAIGSRRGLELWRHLHAWYKGIGPELVQRTVADLLTPERAQSPATSSRPLSA